jgi:hypothetical protein
MRVEDRRIVLDGDTDEPKLPSGLGQVSRVPNQGSDKALNNGVTSMTSHPHFCSSKVL